ncbi:hypothetical protein L8106_28891 [Lyngbya sp. PCC 8106]|nr:hypothetical protein L8106_28891 [Lyngbya sp. PCC 8106]
MQAPGAVVTSLIDEGQILDRRFFSTQVPGVSMNSQRIAS